MDTIQVFISSPSDLSPERLTAVQVIERLSAEFQYFFKVKPIFWEHEPLLATEHFQAGLVSPSECQIMVCMLWSTLGSPLPEQFALAGRSGSATGTEWEFITAANHYRQHGQPNILFYRKTTPVQVDISDEVALRSAQDNKLKLDTFFSEYFHNQDAAHTFKNAYRGFASLADFEEQLTFHLRKLLQEFADQKQHSTTQQDTLSWYRGSPFLGLHAFEVKHAAIFFGRNRARSQLFEQYKQRIHEQKPFLMTIGMSGSGKSSLIKAGLLPLLIAPKVIATVAECRWATFKPSDRPDNLTLGLAQALFASTALPELAASPAQAQGVLTRVAHSPHALEAFIFSTLHEIKITKHYREQYQLRLLIVVDQFEELFTLPDISEEERSDFISLLHSLSNSGHTWLLATLRSDFFAHTEAFPELVELMQGNGKFHLTPPSAAEIEQMIRYPAQAAGLSFEQDQDGVTLAQVLRERSTLHPSALPLLSFVLDELYRRRTKEGLLTFQAYHQLGGLEGAIATRAEAVFAQLSNPQQNEFEALLASLVTLSEDTETVTARAVSQQFLAHHPLRQALVERLIQERLLVSQSSDSSPESATVRFTHEALLQNWQRVKDWIALNIHILKTRTRLASQARYWDLSAQPTVELLPQGTFYEEVLPLYKNKQLDLSPLEVRYIEASREEIEAQQQRAQAQAKHQQQAQKRLQTGAALAAIFVLFFAYQWLRYQDTKATLHEVQAEQKQKHRIFINQSVLQLAKEALDKKESKQALSLLLSAYQKQEALPNGDFRQVVYTALNQHPLLATFSHHYQPSKNPHLLLSNKVGQAPIQTWNGKALWPAFSQFSRTDPLHFYAFENDDHVLVQHSDSLLIELWSLPQEAVVARLKNQPMISAALFEATSKRWIIVFNHGIVRSWDGIATTLATLFQSQKKGSWHLQAIGNSNKIALFAVDEHKLITQFHWFSPHSGKFQSPRLPFAFDTKNAFAWHTPLQLQALGDHTLVVQSEHGPLDLFDSEQGQFLNRLSTVSQKGNIRYYHDTILYQTTADRLLLLQAKQPDHTVTIPAISLAATAWDEARQQLYYIDAISGRLMRYALATHHATPLPLRFSDNADIVLRLQAESQQLLLIEKGHNIINYSLANERRIWRITLARGQQDQPSITLLQQQLLVISKASAKNEEVQVDIIDLANGQHHTLSFLHPTLFTLTTEALLGVTPERRLIRYSLAAKAITFSYALSHTPAAMYALADQRIISQQATESQLWDLNKKQTTVSSNHKLLALSPSGRWLALSSANAVEIVDTLSQQIISSPALLAKPLAAYFEPSARQLFILDSEYTFSKWDYIHGTLTPLLHSALPVTGFRLSQKQPYVALLGQYREVTLWNYQTGTLLETLIHWAKPVNAVFIGEQSQQLITQSTDNRYHYWDVATGEVLRQIEVKGEIDHATAKEGALHYISRYSTGKTQLYDRINQRILGEIPVDREVIQKIKTSPLLDSALVLKKSGELLLIALEKNQQTLLWKAKTSKKSQLVRDTSSYVAQFVYTPAGNAVVFKLSTGQFYCTDLRTQARVAQPIAGQGKLLGTSLQGQYAVTETIGRNPTKHFIRLPIAVDDNRPEDTQQAYVDAFVQATLRPLRAMAIGTLLADSTPHQEIALDQQFLAQEILDIEVEQGIALTRTVGGLLAVRTLREGRIVAQISVAGVVEGARFAPSGNTIAIEQPGRIIIQPIYPTPLLRYAQHKMAY